MADAGGPPGSEVALSAEESHHALRSLRLRPSATVWLTDGRGTVSRATLVEERDGRAVVLVQEQRRHRRPAPTVAVYQGAAKGGKLDDLVDRLAQVGVAETRVFLSRRAVVRWDEPKRAALGRRWEGRARAATKQSRSPWCMVTGPPLGWRELLGATEREWDPIVLWEHADVPLREALSSPARIPLIVGPEGGLEEREVHELEEAGARPVTLGSRILRTENAALVAASAILWHFGAIG
ncbi:MAG TPA: RsmE family RNA methyltransferase [Actinomycetota bacterium]|nr:RsmE family RNA methyltransferase [Actinomycetota bacterium]